MATLEAVCTSRVHRALEAPQSTHDHSRSGATTMGPSPAPPAPLNTSSSCVEILPGVLLIVSVNAAKNQVVIELGKPASTGSDAASAGATTILPPTLLATFRAPRVIQVLEEDEGTITTTELVVERVGRPATDGPVKGSAGGTPIAAMRERGQATSPLATSTATNRLRASMIPAEAPVNPSESSANERPLGEGARTSRQLPPPTLDGVFVHLFIGTSNGTVMVCNALRGTILVMAQFQYHHDFHARHDASHHSGSERDAHGEGHRSQSASAAASRRGEAEPAPAPPSTPSPPSFRLGRSKKNEAVVRFAVQRRGDPAQQWNPDLSIPESGPMTSSFVAPGSCISGVFVVHERGKVVYLGRNVLDTFISVVVNRQDGQRPYFVVEWSPTSTLSSYPVAGPAASVAPMVEYIYTLTPVTNVSENERRTGAEAAGVSTPSSLASRNTNPAGVRVTDAAFLFTQAAAPHELDAILRKGTPEAVVTDALITCGAFPAFALYPLEAQRTTFSAAKAVRAVTSLVAGMARSLWFGATSGNSGDANRAAGASRELPQRLEKKPQENRVSFFEGDCVMSKVSVEPSMQFAAFYAESTVSSGAGRIYLSDVHTGVVWRVLKGYRSADFTWWFRKVLGRPMLLFVVHLPQRGVVEVHSVRLRQRLAACYVPPGSVLLRTAAESFSPSLTEGNHQGVFMLTPNGDILRLCLLADGLQPNEENTRKSHHTDPRTRAMRLTESHGNSREAKSSVLRGLHPDILRSCRSPDDFFDVAMQLHVPHWQQVDVHEHLSRTVRSNLSRFKKYRRQLHSICETLKRRYTPSYTEPRTIAATLTHTADSVSKGERTGYTYMDAIPRGLTAAQCLNYLQLRLSVVDAYVRLALAATPGVETLETTAATAQSDIADDPVVATSGTADVMENRSAQVFASTARLPNSGDENGADNHTALGEIEYWKHCLGCHHTCGRQFWEKALRRVTLLLGSCASIRANGRGTSSTPATGRFDAEVAALKAAASSGEWNPHSHVQEKTKSFSSKDGGFCETMATAMRLPQRTSTDAASETHGEPGDDVIDAPPLDPVDLQEILPWFACGGDRVRFRREWVYQVEDHTNKDVMGRLADLYYGPRGLNVFMKRVEVASALGLDLADLATLTVAWIARRCADNGPLFWMSTSMGRLMFVMETLTPDAFLNAVRRFMIPLGDVREARDNGLMAAASLGCLCRALHGVLLCCAVKLSCGGMEDDDDRRDGFCTAVAQLVRMWTEARAMVHQQDADVKAKERSLWEAAEDLVPHPSSRQQPGQTLGAGDENIVGLRLAYLLPCSGGRDSGCDSAAPDSLESYLLRKRVKLHDASWQAEHQGHLSPQDQFLHNVLARKGVPAAAARLPVVDLCSVLISSGAELYIGANPPTSCFLTAFPWLKEHTWLPEVYTKLVIEPLKDAWNGVSPEKEVPHGATSSPRGGSARSEEADWVALVQSAVLVTGIAALQEAIRPFMEVTFTFCGTETVPDLNLFSQVCSTTTLPSSFSTAANSAPASAAVRGAGWLSGSRAHRDFLTSLSTLTNFVVSMAEKLLRDRGEMQRVLLIQSIAVAVFEDDGFVFPVIPGPLRRRLKVFMQLLGQDSPVLVDRLHRVRSFLALLLFFGNSGSMTLDGQPVDVGGLGGVRVPWSALFGSSLSETFLLYPTASLTTPQGTPLKASKHGNNDQGKDTANGLPLRGTAVPANMASVSFHNEALPDNEVAVRAMMTLARSFLAKCLAPGIALAALKDPGDPADPVVIARLMHADTKNSLGQLCSCFPGLCESVPDLPSLLVLDFVIKYACSPTSETVQRELLYIADRASVARVAAANLRALLSSCVKYCATMKRYYMEHHDKARFDAASQKMISVVHLLSDHCKQWIQRPGRDTQRRGSDVPTANASNATQSRFRHRPTAKDVVGDDHWVTQAEWEMMDRVVLNRLSLPSSNNLRGDFFELLFVLAQVSNEGKTFLPPDARALVGELPGVVDNLRRQL